MTILEICAGGIEDCINAQAAGADRKGKRRGH